jgi:TolA-binding protein
VDWQSSPFITAIVAAMASLVTAVLTLAFGRPKDRADIHATIASGAGMAVDTITDVLEQVRQELEEARKEIEALRKDNAQLRQSLTLLNMRLNDLQKAAKTKKPEDE